ncbi:hypothetical protein V6N13_023102 [Hibiscus sabdariffa]
MVDEEIGFVTWPIDDPDTNDVMTLVSQDVPVHEQNVQELDLVDGQLRGDDEGSLDGPRSEIPRADVLSRKRALLKEARKTLELGKYIWSKSGGERGGDCEGYRSHIRGKCLGVIASREVGVVWEYEKVHMWFDQFSNLVALSFSRGLIDRSDVFSS